MMVRTIGSGSNGLGYYMYHGGTTPSDGFFMHSEGFGLPLKSYDYQSPIREFGNPGKGFYGLKIINNFLNFFGDVLAPLYPVIPESNNNIKADDTTTLRYSVRGDGNKGFVFMHNYQDHVKTVDLQGINIQIKTNGGMVSIPEKGTLTLKSGASAILPFQVLFGNLTFKYATVQPFAILKNNGKSYYIFISIDGIAPEIVIQGNKKISAIGAKILKMNGNTIVSGQNANSFEFVSGSDHYLVIPFEKALNSYITGKPGYQNMLISEALVTENENQLEMITYGQESWNVNIYPKVKEIRSADAKVLPLKSTDKLFFSCNLSVEKVIPELKLIQYDDRHFVLDARKLDLTKISDVFIKFDYRGDRAVCMLNGELATDNLYTSEPWQIALKRYFPILKEKEMYFYFMPMRKDAPYISYLDKDVVPDFSNVKEFLEIKQPEIIPEYKVEIELNE